MLHLKFEGLFVFILIFSIHLRVEDKIHIILQFLCVHFSKLNETKFSHHLKGIYLNGVKFAMYVNEIWQNSHLFIYCHFFSLLFLVCF